MLNLGVAGVYVSKVLHLGAQQRDLAAELGRFIGHSLWMSETADILLMSGDEKPGTCPSSPTHFYQPRLVHINAFSLRYTIEGQGKKTVLPESSWERVKLLLSGSLDSAASAEAEIAFKLEDER